MSIGSLNAQAAEKTGFQVGLFFSNVQLKEETIEYTFANRVNSYTRTGFDATGLYGAYRWSAFGDWLFDASITAHLSLGNRVEQEDNCSTSFLVTPVKCKVIVHDNLSVVALDILREVELGSFSIYLGGGLGAYGITHKLTVKAKDYDLKSEIVSKNAVSVAPQVRVGFGVSDFEFNYSYAPDIGGSDVAKNGAYHKGTIGYKF